jgi:trimeric autotransporter adhesin
MRVRVAGFVLLALAAGGCSGKRSADPTSLRVLNDLSARESNFGVILDAKTGKALTAFRVNNPIRAAIPDGNGGWYIGGGFIHVNGVLRKRLAHIDQNGRLDPDWRPEANGNGVSVTSLARIGSRIYVAGDFARLNRSPRLWIGAVDAATGKLLGWRSPHAAVNYPVLLAGANRLYVGGYGVTSRSGLIALQPDGRPDPAWHAQVDTSNIEGGSVRILVFWRGRLYFAGMFGKVDGSSSAGIASVAAYDGRLLARWRPPLRARYCVACTDVGAMAIGGPYVFAGTSRAIVALDPLTGAIEPGFRTQVGLRAGIHGGSWINSMELARKRLYLAGSFDRVDGARRLGVAAIDAGTGRVVDSWTAAASQASGSVVAASGSRILVGIQLGRAVPSG